MRFPFQFSSFLCAMSHCTVSYAWITWSSFCSAASAAGLQTRTIIFDPHFVTNDNVSRENRFRKNITKKTSLVRYFSSLHAVLASIVHVFVSWSCRKERGREKSKKQVTSPRDECLHQTVARKVRSNAQFQLSLGENVLAMIPWWMSLSGSRFISSVLDAAWIDFGLLEQLFTRHELSTVNPIGKR